MKKTHKLIISVVGVAALVATAIWVYQYISKNYVYHDEAHILVSTTGEKNIAPDFTVFDKKSNEVHLSEHIGKKTVVSFWATWCGACKPMLSDFDEVYEEYSDEVEFMLINLTDGVDETMSIAKKYVREKDIDVPVYYDLSYSAVHAYNIATLPVTVFIDENGYISDIHQGMLSKAQIKEYIEAIGNEGKTLQ